VRIARIVVVAAVITAVGACGTSKKAQVAPPSSTTTPSTVATPAEFPATVSNFIQLYNAERTELVKVGRKPLDALPETEVRPGAFGGNVNAEVAVYAMGKSPLDKLTGVVIRLIRPPSGKVALPEVLVRGLLVAIAPQLTVLVDDFNARIVPQLAKGVNKDVVLTIAGYIDIHTLVPDPGRLIVSLDPLGKPPPADLSGF
jgi:hypothetical protein